MTQQATVRSRFFFDSVSFYSSFFDGGVQFTSFTSIATLCRFATSPGFEGPALFSRVHRALS